MMFAIDVPSGGITAGGSTDLVPLDGYAAKLQSSLGRTIDPELGLVSVTFSTPSTAGGETAMISLPADPPISETGDEVMVESPVLLPDGKGFIAFTNVMTGDVDVQVLGAPGRTECDFVYPSLTTWPVVPLTFTSVPVRCTEL